MSKVFCPHCGSKHEYKMAPPNFCGSCGGNLQSLSIATENNNQEQEKPLVRQKPKSRLASRRGSQDEDGGEGYAKQTVSGSNLDDLIDSMEEDERSFASLKGVRGELEGFCSYQKMNIPKPQNQESEDKN